MTRRGFLAMLAALPAAALAIVRRENPRQRLLRRVRRFVASTPLVPGRWRWLEEDFDAHHRKITQATLDALRVPGELPRGSSTADLVRHYAALERGRS